MEKVLIDFGQVRPKTQQVVSSVFKSSSPLCRSIKNVFFFLLHRSHNMLIFTNFNSIPIFLSKVNS